VNRVRIGSDLARGAGRAVPLIAALTLSSTAHAQSAPVASPLTPPPSIEVVVVGRADAYERLHALLDRRLSAMGSTAWSRAERVDAGDVLALSPGHALRCWIDLGDRRRVRLMFAAPSGERFLVRDFELSGDLDEIDRAALAEVIELSIGALIEDERAGLSREETQALLARRAAGAAALPPPSPVRPVPSGSPPAAGMPASGEQGRRFEIGIFYAAEAVADGLPIDNGPGLSLALSDEIRRHASGPRLFTAAWVSARMMLPETVMGTDASVRLAGGAARLGLEVGFKHLRLRLGAGWDLVHVSSEATSAALAPAGARWTSTFVCEGAIRVGIADMRSSHLWISLLGDVLPTAVDYGIDAGGRFEVVFSPWRIRPEIAVEITY
jgi:hypothetical protein